MFSSAPWGKKKSNYCADNYYTETAWLVHPCRISAALEHYFSTSALGTLLIPRNKHKDPDMVPKDVHDIGLVYFPTPLDTCRPGLLGAGWCGIPPAPSSFSASPALVLTTVSGTGPCETGPPSGKSSDRTRSCVRRCRLASGPCQGRRKKWGMREREKESRQHAKTPGKPWTLSASLPGINGEEKMADTWAENRVAYLRASCSCWT